MEFNRFDVATKELIWEDPADWLERFTNGPRGPVTVIDSDITTLTAGADKVLKVDMPSPTWSTSSPTPTMTSTCPGRSGIVRSPSTTDTSCRCSRSWCCCARRPTRPA